MSSTVAWTLVSRSLRKRKPRAMALTMVLSIRAHGGEARFLHGAYGMLIHCFVITTPHQTGLGAPQCEKLRTYARRFTRPSGQNQRRKRTQNWIKAAGNITSGRRIKRRQRLADQGVVEAGRV